jgi:hypothetical protein
MGWEFRVTPVQGSLHPGTQPPQPVIVVAQWSAGPQGLRWLEDLCHQGEALLTSEKNVGTERYVLSAAVLRNAILGNAVFADASDSRESMTEIMQALRKLPPPLLVFVEARPQD